MIRAKHIKTDEFFKYKNETFKVLYNINKGLVKCINIETNKCTYIDCEIEVEQIEGGFYEDKDIA